MASMAAIAAATWGLGATGESSRERRSVALRASFFPSGVLTIPSFCVLLLFMIDLSRVARHERRLAILRELTERGMSLARVAARKALVDPAGGDLGEAYLKLAQEIRL